MLNSKFLYFFKLEMLRLSRSLYFKLSIFSKILYSFLLICFFILLVILGFNLYNILSNFNPSEEPIQYLNRLLIYWFIFEFSIRYFTQKYPTINIKSFLIIPVKRKFVINYFLLRTLLSIHNFLLLAILIPFVVFTLRFHLNPFKIFGWLFSIFMIVLINNYLVLFIKKNKIAYFTSLILVCTLVVFNYFQLFNFTSFSFAFFNFFYKHPFLSFLLPIIFLLIYTSNFNVIQNKFYLNINKTTTSYNKLKISGNTFDKLFGKSAPILKNDLKLIYRNAKPRQQVIMGFFSIFYGFIFAIDKIYNDFPTMIIFTCTVLTGGFLYTFAQLVPSWDSTYYKLLMCQNIYFEHYLKAKWYLMIIFILLYLILSIPFLYFGFDKFLIIVVTAIFNIGVNSFVTLYIGAFNRKRIELNENLSIFDNNGFSSVQIVLGLLKFALPIITFYPIYKLFGFNIGLLVLVSFGLAGLFIKDKLLEKIAFKYLKRKYKTIASFKEKEWFI